MAGIMVGAISVTLDKWTLPPPRLAEPSLTARMLITSSGLFEDEAASVSSGMKFLTGGVGIAFC